jgi:hypothetical protein
MRTSLRALWSNNLFGGAVGELPSAECFHEFVQGAEDFLYGGATCEMGREPARELQFLFTKVLERKMGQVG